MSKKLVSVTVPAKLGESEKAYKVLYAHFENPLHFAVAWLPKSVTKVEGDIWMIPLWLKNKIAKTAKRYSGVNIQFEGLPDVAYGFGPYYNARGFDVTAEAKERYG